MMQFLVRYIFLVLLMCLSYQEINAQHKNNKYHKKHIKKEKQIHRGTASYYSDKFIGKKTASGERFSQNKLTAACNVLPLGTYVLVTNTSNGKKAKVKINDRLSRNTKRLIDLTKEGAKKLGFLNKGITKVKVELQNK
jgi:rare lipoprotein A